MRPALAPTSAFTDARGHNKRPALTAWQRQARAVVNLPNKPTGVGADNIRAGLTPTHPGKRTQLKLASSLSPRPPDRSRFRVGDEHSLL